MKRFAFVLFVLALLFAAPQKAAACNNFFGQFAVVASNGSPQRIFDFPFVPVTVSNGFQQTTFFTPTNAFFVHGFHRNRVVFFR